MADTPYSRSPLFEAQHASRYERQRLIRDYQQEYSCRFLAIISPIYPDLVTLLEEALYDASPAEDLHIMLRTLGEMEKQPLDSFAKRNLAVTS